MISYRCLTRGAVTGAGPRLDSGTADRLLRRHPVGVEHSDLATVLSAAAAAGQPTELHGRSAALAAFRAAAMMPVTPPKRPSKVRSALVKLLTVKAALFGALVVTGGIAIAAGAAALSRPPATHVAAPPAVSVSAPSSPSSGTVNPPSAVPTPSARRSAPATPKPATSAPTSPSLVTLCRAYIAVSINPTTRGDRWGIDISAGLDSPAFQVLIKAAGGRASVGRFCAIILTIHWNPGDVDPDDGRDTPPDRPRATTARPPNRPPY